MHQKLTITTIDLMLQTFQNLIVEKNNMFVLWLNHSIKDNLYLWPKTY